MRLIERIGLIAAKKYLRTHHFRVKGNVDGVLYPVGDVLLSPNALRLFEAVSGRQFSFDINMTEIKQGSFVGTEISTTTTSTTGGK